MIVTIIFELYKRFVQIHNFNQFEVVFGENTMLSACINNYKPRGIQDMKRASTLANILNLPIGVLTNLRNQQIRNALI